MKVSGGKLGGGHKLSCDMGWDGEIFGGRKRGRKIFET